jgi:hypothetical protein
MHRTFRQEQPAFLVCYIFPSRSFLHLFSLSFVTSQAELIAPATRSAAEEEELG